ncbi:trichohyalin-like [Phyllopteryx taeniolatus]|uniref:trichohyalin-like n=1 Tax=Phyllopteryx taeniolatus TaxID=161469 RepID=UPI002AD35A56|nr:trichohyalin-like [Phyllopteryx taeniolatus]
MEKTQWEEKQDVKNKVWKSSPREQLEEPAGGTSEEQQGEKEGEHLPPASSGQFGNNTINTLEFGLGGKDVETVESQEGQMRSRKNKFENVRKQKKEESDARLTKSHIEDKQTKKNATDTQEHSTLTSAKKKRGIKKRENSETRTKEAANEAKGRQEETTRRRRRAKLENKDDDLNVPSHKQLEDGLEKEEVATEQETCDALDIKSPKSFTNETKADTSVEDDTERLSSDDKHNPDSSVQSVSFQRSPLVSLGTNVRSSPGSSCEGLSADRRVLTSSQGQLSSSCSTVMVTEEQLMLNLVKTEASRRNEEEKARRQAERADIQRQELERRREQEEEERMRLQEERKRTKDNMRTELEEERRRRVEHLRLRKLAEEEVRRRREEEEQERAGREQAERERVRRRQEERRRQMERLQKMREEEEGRRKAEVERLHLEEQRRQEEECKRLQEMDASERDKYLAMKEREEEDRRTKEEEHRMREEEQALRAVEESRVEAELLARHMTQLQQKTAFKRGLLLEAEGMEQSQGISRPWVYSYFTLLQLPDLKPTKTYESITP